MLIVPVSHVGDKIAVTVFEVPLSFSKTSPEWSPSALIPSPPGSTPSESSLATDMLPPAATYAVSFSGLGVFPVTVIVNVAVVSVPPLSSETV